MKKIIFSVIFVFSAMQIFSQTSVKLNGTPIGTQGYLYEDGTDNNGNTVENCFDGNLNTYFASAIDESTANGGTKGSRGSKGGWVGLDLGQKYIITSVKYAPRPSQPARVECGVIEGANSPDFMDAVAIGIVSETGIANQLSTLNINSTRGFRYVRFYGSLQYRCNIAELEFWGYQGAGNDNHIGQLTNLPTINIHTVNEARIADKDNYVNAVITIVNGNYIKTDNLEIRGRGNASWDFKKQPYRMRFAVSTTLFNNLNDFPAKARNWTLISNEGDKTLIRNLMAFDISKRLEMEYTPAGRLVDLVINGDYRGCYQLCDHIDIRAGRVNINEMTASDIDETRITGGYLLEISAYLHSEPNWWNIGFNSNRGVPVEIKSPDYGVQAQLNYVKNHFNTWENEIMNNGNFQQYTDIESFCKHFLVGEFAGNTDTYWQTKIYKKRNDDKIYFGPVWDFDLSFENDSRTYPIMDKTLYQRNNQWLFQWEWQNNSGSSAANGVRPLINKLINYGDVDEKLKEIWAHYRDYGKITEAALLQTVDNYVAEINLSQDLNFKRWDNLEIYEHQMWGRGNYMKNINIVKDYISERLAWLDNKLEYEPNPVENSVLNPEFENVKIFSKNNELIINNLSDLTKIFCFDVSGKIIFEHFADNCFSTPLPQGIYLLKLTKQNNISETFKCVVR